MGSDQGFFGVGFVGFLLMMVFYIGLILIIGYVIYVLLKNAKIIGGEGSTAADILKRRYAKGEITKEQFDEMKKNIS
jgi:putative membrane protein